MGTPGEVSLGLPPAGLARANFTSHITHAFLIPITIHLIATKTEKISVLQIATGTEKMVKIGS